VFIEYEHPEDAAKAIKTKDGTALDKTHKIRVNRFTDVEKYASASDKYVEPEIDPYVQKVVSSFSNAHGRNICEVGLKTSRPEINSLHTGMQN
jgi:hypothetical protein